MKIRRLLQKGFQTLLAGCILALATVQSTAWTVKKQLTTINKEKGGNKFLILANNSTFKIGNAMIDFVNVYDRPGGGANISTNHVLHRI